MSSDTVLGTCGSCWTDDTIVSIQDQLCPTCQVVYAMDQNNRQLQQLAASIRQLAMELQAVLDAAETKPVQQNRKCRTGQPKTGRGATIRD